MSILFLKVFFKYLNWHVIYTHWNEQILNLNLNEFWKMNAPI